MKNRCTTECRPTLNGKKYHPSWHIVTMRLGTSAPHGDCRVGHQYVSTAAWSGFGAAAWSIYKCDIAQSLLSKNMSLYDMTMGESHLIMSGVTLLCQFWHNCLPGYVAFWQCYAKLSHYYVNINVFVDFDLAMSKPDITLAESQLSMWDFTLLCQSWPSCVKKWHYSSKISTQHVRFHIAMSVLTWLCQKMTWLWQNLNSACEISRCYVSYDLAMSKADISLAECQLSMWDFTLLCQFWHNVSPAHA
jgi:hypothetical protein